MDFEFLGGINWLAVLVASIAYFFLGALWYSKLLFVKAWLAHTKIDVNNAEASKGIAGIMAASFIFTFISCFGIAALQSYLGITGWVSGFKLGLLTGLCFGAMAISISYVYEKRPVGLHLINNGYTIAGHIIAAIIICSWV